MRLMPPNNGPGRQFLDKASRKRKALDSDCVSTVCDNASTRVWPQPIGNSGHLLPRESSSQHNVCTINTQQKSADIFPNIHSHIAKPANEQSECGDYQFYGMNNSLISFPRRDGNFQDPIVDSLHHKIPSSVIKTPIVGIPNLPGAGNYGHDTGRHSEASTFQSYHNQSSNYVEKTQADLRSSRGMGNGLNPGLGNNLPYIQPPPQMLSSRDLTFLGPSQLKTVNADYNQDGVYAQDFSKSGFVEAKKAGLNMLPAEDINLSIHTTNSYQTSIDERKENCGSYQYSDTKMRSSDYPHNHSLDAHVNVRDEDMLQLPVSAETSGLVEACLENGLSQYTSLVSKDRTKSVQKNDLSNDGNKRESSGEETSSKTLPSLNLDKQSKSAAARISSVVEKLWDGLLQLNTSTTVSVVAIFKRMSMINRRIVRVESYKLAKVTPSTA